MKRVTILMVALLVFVAIGNVQAELSDKDKAVLLSGCMADCQALKAFDVEPPWTELHETISMTFGAQAFQLYGGPDKDIQTFFKQREQELLRIYAQSGRSALIIKARAAASLCSDISWSLIKSSGQ